VARNSAARREPPGPVRGLYLESGDFHYYDALCQVSRPTEIPDAEPDWRPYNRSS